MTENAVNEAIEMVCQHQPVVHYVVRRWPDVGSYSVHAVDIYLQTQGVLESLLILPVEIDPEDAISVTFTWIMSAIEEMRPCQMNFN